MKKTFEVPDDYTEIDLQEGEKHCPDCGHVLQEASDKLKAKCFVCKQEYYLLPKLFYFAKPVEDAEYEGE